MGSVRVRFAPSPTGYLHIGGARTALFNWLFARRQQGKLVLRIEDTDTERLKQDSVSQILTSLKWLGLDWDEGPEAGGGCGPYYQSERLELYRREAERLVSEGKAYYCFCTPDELAAVREGQRQAGAVFAYNGTCRTLDPDMAKRRLAAGEKAVIRLRTPDSGHITVRDLVRGDVTFSLDQLDDSVIVKSNGMPTYNFACVVDDHAMAISHVIRAEEHLPNTPKQLLLYEALGYTPVQFAHVAMILAPDRSKLSKRHGATSVEEFREQGFLAPAIVNYLTLLGWSPGGEQELITPEAAIAQFDLEKVSKTAAVYDTRKLAWINGQYLNSMDLDAVTAEAIPFFIRGGLIDAAAGQRQYDYIRSVVGLLRSRVKTLQELAEMAAYFFCDISDYEEKGVRKYFAAPATALLLQQRLQAAPAFDAACLEAVYQQLIADSGVKTGELIHPTRLAVTGRTVSPGLFEVMELLGRDRCCSRLAQALRFIGNLPPQ